MALSFESITPLYRSYPAIYDIHTYFVNSKGRTTDLSPIGLLKKKKITRANCSPVKMWKSAIFSALLLGNICNPLSTNNKQIIWLLNYYCTWFSNLYDLWRIPSGRHCILFGEYTVTLMDDNYIVIMKAY